MGHVERNSTERTLLFHLLHQDQRSVFSIFGPTVVENELFFINYGVMQFRLTKLQCYLFLFFCFHSLACRKETFLGLPAWLGMNRYALLLLSYLVAWFLVILCLGGISNQSISNELVLVGVAQIVPMLQFELR